MDLMNEYNNAINILGGYDIRGVRAKLNTPQAEQIMQALRIYVAAYLETVDNLDSYTRDTAENAWVDLMRMADDDFQGLPEP
jgi:hypothetical protein